MSFSSQFSDYQLDDNKNKNNKKRLSTLGKPMAPSTDLDKQKTLERVTQVLNTNDDDDDNGLGYFNSTIENPILNKKPEFDNNVNPELMKYTPDNIQSDTIERPTYGNYNQIYEQPMSYIPTRKPYYANMGISSSGSEMDKIMEKLNYMTHLLEEQKNERTNNIGEEFVLYTFLGVFIIYVVDSFSRSGKYTR
jgi:hypothetical protein